jgi:glycosyltransferase involved in cell wall biosynthesis
MAERLRIAHLTPVYPPYAAGSGVACHYQAAEQARRGHDVSVWTVAIPGEAPPTGADVRRLPALVQLGAAPLLPGLYRLPPVDVIHVHHPFIFGIEPALFAALRRPHTALVVSYHNRLIGSGLRRALFFGYEETMGRLLARRADRLVALSREHAETISYLRTARRRRPERLSVVPNAVDAELFSPGDAPGLRRELGIPGDAVVAVHVATLDRTHFLKRTDLAVEAVVRAGEPRLHLVVVGDGEWRARLENGHAARRLGERVHFIGHRDHDTLPEALRASDFFLLSSDRDSFSLVLLEAFACGLPAVTTDPAGVRAMVAGSDAASFARAGDADGLAAAVRDMVRAGEDERRRRGRLARALCLERYSIEAVVDRLDDLYAEALEARSGYRSPVL